MTSPRAIVVGAGSAGISAAFRLQQAGVDVRVVESDVRVGGRCRTERIDGFIVDTAAGLMPGTYKAVYRLMQDAGLGDLLDRINSPTAVVRDGKLHYLDMSNVVGSIATTHLLSLKSKLQLVPLALRALRMGRRINFENAGMAAPFDTETLAEYAQRALSPELLEYLVEPTMRIMYTVSAKECSVVDFFWCFKNLLSPSAYCVRGGMERFVSGVAEKLAVSVKTQALSVRQRGEQVEVALRGSDGRESTEVVDLCVIATPARDVPKIHRELSAPSREFLTRLKYSYLTDIHLRLRERPAEKAVLLMVPESLEPDVGGILLDHNKGADRAPPGKGALSVYFMHHWAEEVFPLSDQEIFSRGLPKIERVMPGIGKLVEGYHVQRWDFAATVSYPGYYKELAGFIDGLDFTSRVQLAGDYFSMASVNSAVTSGEIAARNLIENHVTGHTARSSRATSAPAPSV